MSLRFRRLRIRVTTSDGIFGVEIPFVDGLNVIRADNTSGKSTCFQAILYALGLDAMLTARQHQLPLTPVLTDNVFDEASESELRVQSTELWLEVEGGGQEVATFYRPVVGLGDHRLITVYESHLADDMSTKPGRQMFVRIPGAATGEHGFHRWFAKDFLKWELPQVERNDGRSSQLYLETIFPLFFVEQRFGWTRIQGNMPYVFGIRDVARRAAEYVLGLSISETQLQRVALGAQLRELQGRYSAIAKSMQALAGTSGSLVRGVPDSMPGDDLAANILIPQDGKWLQLPERQSFLRGLIQTIGHEMKERRRAASSQILGAQHRRAELLQTITERQQILRTEAQERLALGRRRDDLIEQLRKLTDLRSLARMGGRAGGDVFGLHCPTCWQPVADSASPGIKNVLSLDDTISFVDSEQALLQATLAQVDARSRALTAELQQLERELNVVDASIETSHASSDDDGLVVQTTQYVEYRHQLQSLDRLAGELSARVDEANALIRESVKLRTAMSLLPVGLSQEDEVKLKDLEETFRSQEREYGFKSFAIDELSISRETYKPTVHDFELSFETSASDGIRTIWSYLFGLLELRRGNQSMHHIGSLIFDEPRQQSTAEFSFGQLLRHASLATVFGDQAIFFTSDEAEAIRAELMGSTYNMVEFAGRMIRRL